MALRHRAVATLPNRIGSLRKDFPKAIPNQLLPSLRRAFSVYDQINLIDNVPEDQLRFQGYTNTGFMVNGVQYEGSLLCVGNSLMSWIPKKLSGITPDSLFIFQIVRPIPGTVNLLILKFDTSFSLLARLEAIDSRNAASTYNIVNEEGRIVAAALLRYEVSS